MSGAYSWTVLIITVLLRTHLTVCDEDASFFSDTDGFGELQVMTSLPEFESQPIHDYGLMSPGNSDTKLQHFIQTTGKSKSNIKETCNKLLTNGGWGYYPLPGSCNQYIHCDKQSNGYLETCAVGTFFNGHQCVRTEDVDCYFDPCRKMPTGHRYSDGQTCYGFNKCLFGKSVSGSCPAGFSFNVVKQGCLSDPMCVQHTSIVHPCFAGTTMPFPGQPHMFYLWDGYKSVTEMTCPNGLWYNPKICACDWVEPGMHLKDVCAPMFHFGYNGDFLEEYNKAPQAPNTGVSLYKKSALFGEGGQIVIWMMNDIDLESDWALCFEFMTQSLKGEIALVSNDWEKNHFTYKITYIPAQQSVRAYFRMKNGGVVELVVFGAIPHVPHFVRMAKIGPVLKLRVDNIPAAIITTDSGIATAPVPMVIGSANGCDGFVGFFDELKFFRCVPETFFSDYKGNS